MDTPDFKAGLLYVRDDQAQSQNIGVFYNAPSWKDPDFFAFLLLQRLFSNYTQEHHLENVADVKR